MIMEYGPSMDFDVGVTPQEVLVNRAAAREAHWRWDDARRAISRTIAESGISDDDPHFRLVRIWLRYASVHCGGYEIIASGESRCNSFYSLSQLSEQISNLIAGASRYTARWWQL